MTGNTKDAVAYRDEMIRIFDVELSRLYEAQKEMKNACSLLSPGVPALRLRTFCIAPGVVWPNGEDTSSVRAGTTSAYVFTAGRLIFDACGPRPRVLLRALRRIQAAIEWCHSRTEGLRRAHRELCGQQSRAVKALESVAAVITLSGGKS